MEDHLQRQEDQDRQQVEEIMHCRRRERSVEGFVLPEIA